MELAELSTMLKHFYVGARNISGRKTIQSQHYGSHLFWAGQIFICSPQRKPFSIIRDRSIQAGKRSSRFISERSCATRIDFFHQPQASNFQRRPWSPLCSKSAWSEYSRKSFKLGMVYTILFFGKRGRENQCGMKLGDLQLKTTIGRIVLKILHLPSKLCFSAKCSFFGQSSVADIISQNTSHLKGFIS